MKADTPSLSPSSGAAERFDVVIVGAGISGIGCAHELRRQCPNLSFVILDALEGHGGTWRIHRYPGARSDSDLFTFGYGFKPWQGNPIASREQILDYLASAIDEAELEPHIRYQHRVRSAAWTSESNSWFLDVATGDEGESIRLEAGFLLMCQGYYRHDKGHTPDWPGLERFQGEVIHPQHWPEGIDLAGKRVTVIGSGATAATLIPALADSCAHVTMLQRTPTYFALGRNADALADELRRLEVDEAWIHEIMRRKVVRDRADLISRAHTDPDGLRDLLIAGVQAALPEGYDVERHFTPPYRPLQQRVAFVPDGDLFRAIRAGKASVATDTIEAFDEQGIRLASGERIDSDVVITATGFDMAVMGEIPFTVDGEAVDFAETVAFRGMLFTGVPNLAWVYGYGHYSWTLRVELVADVICRLLRHMRETGAKRLEPTIPADHAGMARLPWVDAEDLNSGYLMRSLARLPRRGDRPEWQHSQDYEYEQKALAAIDPRDPVFAYSS